MGALMMLNSELDAQARELEVQVMADGRLVAPGWPPPGFSTDDSDTGGPRIFIDGHWLLSPSLLITPRDHDPDSLAYRKREAVATEWRRQALEQKEVERERARPWVGLIRLAKDRHPDWLGSPVTGKPGVFLWTPVNGSERCHWRRVGGITCGECVTDTRLYLGYDGVLYTDDTDTRISTLFAPSGVGLDLVRLHKLGYIRG